MANEYDGLSKRCYQINVYLWFILICLSQLAVGFSIKDNDDKLVKTSNGILHSANVKTVIPDSGSTKYYDKFFAKNLKGQYRPNTEESVERISVASGVKRAWDSDSARVWGKRGWDTDSTRVWGKRSSDKASTSTSGGKAWKEESPGSKQASNSDFTRIGIKRAWDTDSTRVWGKRGWDSESTRAWGKRGWDSESTRAWGKRAWDSDAARAWGKRAWDSESARVWGKRNLDLHSRRIRRKENSALNSAQAKEDLENADGLQTNLLENSEHAQIVNNLLRFKQHKFREAINGSQEVLGQIKDSINERSDITNRAELVSYSDKNVNRIPEFITTDGELQNTYFQRMPSNTNSIEYAGGKYKYAENSEAIGNLSDLNNHVKSKGKSKHTPSKAVTETTLKENFKTESSHSDTAYLPSINSYPKVPSEISLGESENLKDRSVSDIQSGFHKLTKRSLSTDEEMSLYDPSGFDSLTSNKRVWDTDSIRVWGKRSLESPEYDEQGDLEPWEHWDSDSESLDKRAWDAESARVWGKRAWDTDSARVWGKRAWDAADAARVWGKRAWDTDSTRVWGKRAWDTDSARVWGKRAWDSDSARVWGKRAWDTDSARVWGKRAWDTDSTRVWGKRAWDPDSARVWGKRSWKNDLPDVPILALRKYWSEPDAHSLIAQNADQILMAKLDKWNYLTLSPKSYWSSDSAVDWNQQSSL